LKLSLPGLATYASTDEVFGKHRRSASFAEIARQERRGERHTRLLAPLAFVSPRILAAIIEGIAPAGLTVTGLARASSHSWAEQDRIVGLQ